MGSRRDRQRAHAIGMVSRNHPRDHAPEVVPDEIESIRAERVGHAKDIGDEQRGLVRGHVVGAGAGGVAPLIECHRPEAGVGERRELQPPRARRLREAVQQDHRPPGRGSGFSSPEHEPGGGLDLHARCPTSRPALCPINRAPTQDLCDTAARSLGRRAHNVKKVAQRTARLNSPTPAPITESDSAPAVKAVRRSLLPSGHPKPPHEHAGPQQPGVFFGRIRCGRRNAGRGALIAPASSLRLRLRSRPRTPCRIGFAGSSSRDGFAPFLRCIRFAYAPLRVVHYFT